MKKTNNKETQILLTYIESNEAIADSVYNLIEEAREEGRYLQSSVQWKGYTRQEIELIILSQSLCSWFVATSPDLLDTVYHELLKNAMMQIDWREVASYLLDDVYSEVYA